MAKKNTRRIFFNREKFCSLLTEQNYNDFSFGKISNISSPTIKRYRLGKSIPTLKKINRFAAVLGTGISNLVYFSKSHYNSDFATIDTKKIGTVIKTKNVGIVPLADKLNIDICILTGWLSGFKKISYDSVRKVADALDCNIKWFF